MPVGDTHDVIGTIELEHNGRVYEIMRSIKYTCIGDKKVRASLPKATISFLQDDGQTKTEIGSTFDQNIERILPKSLSSYFFFGGERVGTISSRDDVEASVKGLMGLDVLSNAMTHLRGAIKKFKSGMDFSGDDRASQASSQLEDANQRLSNYQDELKNIEDQLDYYTGEQQTVVLNKYDEDLMTATNTTGVLAKNYTTTVALNNTVKYEWSDGTDTNLSLEWNIEKAKVEVPTLKATEFPYTGSEVDPTELITGFDPEIMIASGSLTGIEMGQYTIVYTLKDSNNYEWTTGEESYTLNWTISKGKLTKPQLDPATYAYTGETITPTLKYFNSTLMQLSGNTNGSPVGSYTLIISLKDKDMYTWSDGTTADLKLTWKISFGVPELKATSTYNSVKLTWTEVEGAAGYQVYTCNSKGASCKKLTTTEGLTYTDKKLSFNKKYYYKVRAYRLDEGSKIYGTFTDLLTKKTALTKTTVTATTDRYKNVLVEWKKVTGATRYYVYRCDEKGANCKNIGFAYDTDLINTTAEEGVTYTYKVRAYRSGIYGAYSVGVEGMRLDDTISYSVKNISYLTNKITINKVDTATKYYIYRSTSKTGTYKKIKTITYSGEKAAGEKFVYEDTDVEFNKKYYYKVKIANDVSTSDFSAIKSVTTNTIAVPTFDFEIEYKFASINIDKVDGATGYQIMYSTDNETFTKLANTKELSYARKFEEDGTYYIKIRAYKKVGTETFYSNYSEVQELIIATEK